METDEITLINEILPRLNADRADAYEDWLAVGMALHHAGAPCELWENWSRQSFALIPMLSVANFLFIFKKVLTSLP
ncbi:MAG: PriCT-2 domain-containing protein [Opitutales bacterium]|nr:PriCT-2 domain-containing protein [Opitutales bacterium]